MTIKSRASRPRFSMRVFDSPKLFWVVLGIFLFVALWMALSSAYSMAYDEYYHYGIIQLYTHQLSPFFAHQPVGADAFGAVSRDPSYMYHYLMSFPLRIFAHFVHTFVAQIIFLRLFDIAFFVGGLLFFRAAFKRAKISLRTSNLALGFFMLIPVTPFVAAQVNYDDLLFLLTGITIWLAVLVSRSIRSEKRLPVLSLCWLASTALLASLVKYAYLPILVAFIAYFGVLFWKNIGHKLAQINAAVRHGLVGTKRWHLMLAVIFLLLSFGLFVERYGINTVRYHSPTPECDQVLALNRCQAYEPFARNYMYHESDYDFPARMIAVYPINWVRDMVRSLFFVVSNKENNYQVGEPLPLARAAGYVVLAGGLALVVFRSRWLWRQKHVNQLFLVVSGTYVVLLFVQNFMDFMHTHVPVAIQGRYLVPVLPLFLVLVAQVAGSTLRRVHPRANMVVLVLLCVLLLEGGSLIPFIVRGQDAWLWNAPIVRHVNHAARDVLRPLVIGS